MLVAESHLSNQGACPHTAGLLTASRSDATGKTNPHADAPLVGTAADGRKMGEGMTIMVSERVAALEDPSAVRKVHKSDLKLEDLVALAAGKLLVLQVRGFVSASLCATLADRAIDHGYASYLNVPSVKRIGMAFYETEARPELVETYFSQARRHISDFRRACAPWISPIDELRCMLDELWPHGAMLQTLGRRKMFVGLSRRVDPGTTFLAHHDIFAQDAPGFEEASSLLSQLGANVYLQMPAVGGALMMWRRELPPAEFDALRGDDYGLPVERLGPPDFAVTPEAGDLLIFNSRKLHAVSPGAGQSRLTVSCFIGYRGLSEPLTFWS